MVPKGWSHTTLGKVMAFKNGLNFTKADVGEEIKIVGVSDFKDLSELRSTERLESVNVASNIKDDELLTDGDLLFVRSNGNKDLIGRCLFFPEVKERLSFSGFTIRGRVDKKNILPQYIAFVARSSFFKSQISQYGGGTNISNLSQQILNDIALPLPPHHEQKKIVQILSSWDRAFSITEQLLANSQQQKKALMQQLLTGKKRLLDKNGVRFSGEWKKVRLGTVADMNSGGTPKSNIEEYYGGNIPWVSIADMTKQGKWISSTEKNLTELGLENSSARIYPKNSVLYAMYASIGECSIAQVPLSSSQAILGIRPKSELNFEFLYFFLTSLKEEIKLQGQQGTQSNLNAGMVKDFLLYLPEMEEQKKIATVLSTADQEITALQQKLDALKQEKKALMQQLLTGKRRVKVEEAA
ncbi:restriction endonuclease subunit S [Aeromonas sp. sia0103]|uniref:restriction endonuclease subunit S n=1 Tax=Aeromonas sp. sia0103 TaxID=2854782 RepID=UPI001C49555E|nr:restriction endonuclease subunit S [Aeromonas sp. sia0103]MBV7599732.1 restriction endonuclease subunit S [Aeromonas sp. sia0103]